MLNEKDLNKTNFSYAEYIQLVVVNLHGIDCCNVFSPCCYLHCQSSISFLLVHKDFQETMADRT